MFFHLTLTPSNHAGAAEAVQLPGGSQTLSGAMGKLPWALSVSERRFPEASNPVAGWQHQQIHLAASEPMLFERPYTRSPKQFAQLRGQENPTSAVGQSISNYEPLRSRQIWQTRQHYLQLWQHPMAFAY